MQFFTTVTTNFYCCNLQISMYVYVNSLQVELINHFYKDGNSDMNYTLPLTEYDSRNCRVVEHLPEKIK